MILFRWNGSSFFCCVHIGWAVCEILGLGLVWSCGGCWWILQTYSHVCFYVLLFGWVCVCALVSLCLLWELLVLIVLVMKIVKKVMVWKVMVVVILERGCVVWTKWSFFKCIFLFGSCALFASNHDHKFWTILIIKDLQKSKPKRINTWCYFYKYIKTYNKFENIWWMF